MFSKVSAFTLLAALLHATWNALLHGNRDRFLSISWMSLAIVPVAALAVLFLPAPLRASWPYLIASGLIHIKLKSSSYKFARQTNERLRFIKASVSPRKGERPDV